MLPTPRLLLIAAALTTASGDPVKREKTAARIVTIVARDYAFEAPDTIPAGRTQVRLLNKGGEMHHAYLIRLEGGKNLNDLMTAFKAGGPPPTWAHEVGGPNAAAGPSAAVVDLTAGTYALICVIPAADGTPHVMKGMSHTFTVVNSAKATPTVKVATPDVTVDLADYNFALSRPLSRGPHVIRVRNTAEQSHEMFVAKLAPGKTPKEVLAWIESPKGPPPLTPLGGTVGLARGAYNDISLDLTPGDYALFCFIPDARDGKPHVAHGMIKPFTVR